MDELKDYVFDIANSPIWPGWADSRCYAKELAEALLEEGLIIDGLIWSVSIFGVLAVGGICYDVEYEDEDIAFVATYLFDWDKVSSQGSQYYLSEVSID